LQVPPKPDTGARGGLEALAARGLRLAVVSNTMRTPGRTLRRILEGHGLLAPFQHLTFSDEVGVRKPAAEIFRLTLQALDIPAAEAVHVGDDAVLDVQGAREAGLRTVQVVPAAAAAPRARRRHRGARRPARRHRDAGAPRMIRAVTFDFWQTLVDDAPENLAAQQRLRLEALRGALARAGMPLDPDEAAAGFARSQQVLDARFWS
jgi:HAD superfamily hydrolase (TIGR01509 family)